MRALLCIVMALFFFSPAALAQTNAPADSVEVPAQFKGFFDDYAALAKKYPAAASRFGVFDRKNPIASMAEGANPIMRSSFCGGPNQCCTKYVDEGSLRCVECSFCPK